MGKTSKGAIRPQSAPASQRHPREGLLRAYLGRLFPPESPAAASSKARRDGGVGYGDTDQGKNTLDKHGNDRGELGDGVGGGRNSSPTRRRPSSARGNASRPCGGKSCSAKDCVCDGGGGGDRHVVPNTLGAYDLGRVLGSGSYGTVYEARERVAAVRGGKRARYAVKKVRVAHLSVRKQARALSEVLNLRLVGHENVVGLRSAFVEGGHMYLVMDFVAGGDLQGLVERRAREGRRLKESEIWRILWGVGRGLAHLHSLRVVHRDVKLLNILVDSDGTPKLADLGVSRVMEQGAMLESRVGTPLYLAPELVRGERYDFKVDVWSLGCVAYTLVALRPPFRGKNVIELGRAIVHDDPPPLPSHCSDQLRTLTMRMLSKDPAGRPTVEEVLTAFPRGIRAYFAARGENAWRLREAKKNDAGTTNGHHDKRANPRNTARRAHGRHGDPEEEGRSAESSDDDDDAAADIYNDDDYDDYDGGGGDDDDGDDDWNAEDWAEFEKYLHAPPPPRPVSADTNRARRRDHPFTPTGAGAVREIKVRQFNPSALVGPSKPGDVATPTARSGAVPGPSPSRKTVSVSDALRPPRHDGNGGAGGGRPGQQHQGKQRQRPMSSPSHSPSSPSPSTYNSQLQSHQARRKDTHHGDEGQYEGRVTYGGHKGGNRAGKRPTFAIGNGRPSSAPVQRAHSPTATPATTPMSRPGGGKDGKIKPSSSSSAYSSTPLTASGKSDGGRFIADGDRPLQNAHRSASVSDLALPVGFGLGESVRRPTSRGGARGFVTPSTERRALAAAEATLAPRGSQTARPASAKPTVHDLLAVHARNARRAKAQAPKA